MVRPFIDLLWRINADNPATVLDVGCGAGNPTELLTQRWPSARVVGLDSSPEMIAAAQAQGQARSDEVEF